MVTVFSLQINLREKGHSQAIHVQNAQANTGHVSLGDRIGQGMEK